MKYRGLDFVRAKIYLQEHNYLAATAATPASFAAAKAPVSPAKRPSAISEQTALKAVRDGERGLRWRSEAAAKARHYLNKARGLDDQTIRDARLGFAERRVEWLPGRPIGLLIPWWTDDGRLVKLIIRQPDNCQPKYRILYISDPIIYPRLSAIVPGRPLIVVEGEFDCLLMQQELGDTACVVTCGSAAARPPAAILEAALGATGIFAAHDADSAGDEAASRWPGSIRIRPPEGAKDWTEARLRHVNLREFWEEILS
jgi:hypothetical protein